MKEKEDEAYAFVILCIEVKLLQLTGNSNQRIAVLKDVSQTLKDKKLQRKRNFNDKLTERYSYKLLKMIQTILLVTEKLQKYYERDIMTSNKTNHLSS